MNLCQALILPIPLSVIGKPTCQLFDGDAGILDYLVLVFLFITINYTTSSQRRTNEGLVRKRRNERSWEERRKSSWCLHSHTTWVRMINVLRGHHPRSQIFNCGCRKLISAALRRILWFTFPRCCGHASRTWVCRGKIERGADCWLLMEMRWPWSMLCVSRLE